MGTFNERIKPFSELPGLKSQLIEFKFKLESLEKIKESVSAENYINLSSTNQKQINELTAKVELLSSGLVSLKNEIELDSQMLESENSILEKKIGELDVLMGGGALSKKDHDEKLGKLKQKIAKNKSQNTANLSSLKELDYYATYIGNESYIKHTYNEGLGNVKSKFSNIRPRTWISLGIIVLLVIAGIFLYNPVKEIIAEKMDWNKAVKENTYDAYGNFITKYPASKKFQEAIAKQEDVFWVQVKKEISLDQIDHYISLYPSGIYLNEANLIKDSLIWSVSSKSDNLNDYQNYINLYPEGKFSLQARGKIKEILAAISLVDTTSQGDVIAKETLAEGEQIFESFAIQEKPVFPGGDAQLFKYIAEHTMYPAEAKEKGIAGSVYIRFVITKYGHVANAKVMREVDPLLEKEALRVVSTLPTWIPGKNNGKPVNVWFIMPVKFKL